MNVGKPFAVVFDSGLAMLYENGIFLGTATNAEQLWAMLKGKRPEAKKKATPFIKGSPPAVKRYTPTGKLKIDLDDLTLDLEDIE